MLSFGPAESILRAGPRARPGSRCWWWGAGGKRSVAKAARETAACTSRALGRAQRTHADAFCTALPVPGRATPAQYARSIDVVVFVARVVGLHHGLALAVRWRAAPWHAEEVRAART